MGRRSKVSEKFRRNAAQLALDGGRSVREVARELGVDRALPAAATIATVAAWRTPNSTRPRHERSAAPRRSASPAASAPSMRN